MATETIEYYSYVLESETTSHDSQYHEARCTTVRVLDPETGAVIHTVSSSSRSGHQLKKHHRQAEDRSDAALYDAQRWILDNCPRAQRLYREAQERAAAATQEAKRRRYQALGENPLAYIFGLTETVNATTLARILGLESVRRANQYLLEWNIQTHRYDGYWPVNSDHAELVGKFAQLRWNVRGLKAAWDAGVARGVFTGGDQGFVERIRATTPWLDFLK
ncbi:hypothetical protein ACN28S_57255 [Cystobacter fuscus]